jgi:hypothetical protein
MSQPRAGRLGWDTGVRVDPLVRGADWAQVATNGDGSDGGVGSLDELIAKRRSMSGLEAMGGAGLEPAATCV